jgi:hypothetical protein
MIFSTQGELKRGFCAKNKLLAAHKINSDRIYFNNIHMVVFLG